MLPTPTTHHLDFSRIYEPAEDSFLLLDAISADKEVAFLTARFQETTWTPVALEVGVGSGVALSFLTANALHILGRRDVLTIGTDINPCAVQGAAETVNNAVQGTSGPVDASATLLDLIQGDLASAFRLASVDILLFNPPYVPSEDVPHLPVKEADTVLRDLKLLALATDGGVDGMEVTKRLFAELPHVLSARGVAYIVAIASNKPEDMKQTIMNHGDQWRTATIAKRRAGAENLQIIRIWRE